MRSSLMWRSRFLLTTSLVAASASGCGDDCGPGGAAINGLVASSIETTLTYGSLIARAGNDCPAADAGGVVSLTIEGKQAPDPSLGLITFCIPRPDQLDAGSHTLGTSQSMADVKIIDLQGSADNCTYSLDSTRPPTGDATGTGVCGNGTSSKGFALIIDGAVSLRRTCGATIDNIAVTLTGTVEVKAEAASAR